MKSICGVSVDRQAKLRRISRITVSAVMIYASISDTFPSPQDAPRHRVTGICYFPAPEP
jgi:hypothetical protein